MTIQMEKEKDIQKLREYTKPATDAEIFRELEPVVANWFKQHFKSFTESQKHAIIPIKHRKNILVSSPTGSGKTLCAFTSILNYLIDLDEKKELENKVYCVYISPLKSLVRDIEVNLKQPLAEMEQMLGKKIGIRVSVRTGDTTSYEKSKMLKQVPHILVTTPESLSIVLNAVKFAQLLEGVEFCIVDEIHALANKRGVHLSLSLERLCEISKLPVTRIGLSATISPLEEVAMFLTGYRQCLIADVQFLKKIDINVLSPAEGVLETEVHSTLYKLIDKLIQDHKTTLIFTNTRSATERVIHHLKEMFPSRYVEDIGAHHSSLSKIYRFNVEERLRRGELKVVVTSTSLELGIDIGYIDLVILLGSPKSVARSMQRIGRAGHKLHDTARGRFIVMDKDDLVECSVILKEAKEKHIDKIKIPKNCLDVLAQQIYGMAIYKIWNIDEMFSLIKKSYCYFDLSKNDFMSVISYLAGEYELEARNVYAKIWYDSETKEIGKRGKLARVIYMTNIGTIPEESFINVVVAGGEHKGEKVGVIDEVFLEKMKPGDIFVLGGKKYQYHYTRGMNIYVTAGVHKQPTIPSWFSEMLPLSFDLALSIQKFRKLMEEKLEKLTKKKSSPEEIKEFIKKYLYVNDEIASEIYDYFYEQYKYAGLPHENKILIENYKAEKNYVIFHSLYGRRVNDALSRAIAYIAAKFRGRDIEIGINDNGFFLAGEKINVDKALKMLNPENLREVLKEAIEKTEILKRRFRHCASRSLMILRTYKGRRKSVGKQQMSSSFLLGTVKKLEKSEEFPILKEARREVLEDLMDIENAKKVLQWIKNKEIKIQKISTKIPSPFSLNLIIQGYSDLIRIEDKIAFIRRMHKAIRERIGEGEEKNGN